MSKKTLVALSICLASCFVACGTTYKEGSNTSDITFNGYCTGIKSWEDANYEYSIVYANDTKVKYLVIDGLYTFSVTPLLNVDGTPQIYEEE